MPLAILPWLLGGAAVVGVGYATYSTTQKLTFVALVLLVIYGLYKVTK